MHSDYNELLGKTMKSVTSDGERMVFESVSGEAWEFYHSQCCCENVRIEDICGDLGDLVGAPILTAEEVSSEGAPTPDHSDSYTWTFYRFATINGSVTVRWLGESNGYYSESVDFRRR